MSKQNMSTTQVKNNFGFYVLKDTIHWCEREYKNFICLKSHYKQVDWIVLESARRKGTSDYYSVAKRSGMNMMSEIAIGITSGNSRVLYSVDDKAVSL